MILYSTVKCYVYKSEEEQIEHQRKMESQSYRLWLKEWVGNRLCCDYVKERKNAKDLIDVKNALSSQTKNVEMSHISFFTRLIHGSRNDSYMKYSVGLWKVCRMRGSKL